MAGTERSDQAIVSSPYRPGLERVSCNTLVAACVFLLSDFLARGSITPLRAGRVGVSWNEAQISLLL